jgi:hypothetical protein
MFGTNINLLTLDKQSKKKLKAEGVTGWRIFRHVTPS